MPKIRKIDPADITEPTLQQDVFVQKHGADLLGRTYEYLISNFASQLPYWCFRGFAVARG